jgi:MoxR-like ATPase
MNESGLETALAWGRRLTTDVLAPLKSAFVGKDEVIDLLGVCLAAGENLFILGPPGTAKSALVQELGKRLEGRVFDYLLTRFTEPNELFGPFDIRKLREGELVTNTEGMLPEASFVFLDELLNANSAILNSLLLVLNERVFRRGRETRKLPLLMVVGASNRLPEDDALAALFDRFLLRVHCDNVGDERLGEVLEAGWKLGLDHIERLSGVSVEDIRRLHGALGEVDLAPMRSAYIELVHRLRRAGIAVSDRRAVKLQRLVAASSLLCGRAAANRSDLWVLRYIWDTQEQQEVVATVVQEAIAKADDAEMASSHPRARGGETPSAEELARELERLQQQLAGTLNPTERAVLRDQLGLLSGRCAWVVDMQARTFLEAQTASMWKQLELSP